MPKLRVDSSVKCRTISGSASSGSRGGRSRRSSVGNRRGREGRTSATCRRGGRVATSRRSASSRHQRLDEPVDVSGCSPLRDGDEQRVVEPCVVATERVARMHATPAGLRDRLLGAPSGANGKLLECCPIGKHELEPGVDEPSFACSPRLMQVSPTSRNPSGPSHDRWTSPARASRVWFVVMFDVAFSRRMCCSRVCSVRT